MLLQSLSATKYLEGKTFQPTMASLTYMKKQSQVKLSFEKLFENPFISFCLEEEKAAPPARSAEELQNLIEEFGKDAVVAIALGLKQIEEIKNIFDLDSPWTAGAVTITREQLNTFEDDCIDLYEKLSTIENNKDEVRLAVVAGYVLLSDAEKASLTEEELRERVLENVQQYHLNALVQEYLHQYWTIEQI